MSKLRTQPYRGTRDFLPEEMSVRLQIFDKLYRVVETFGYVRYDGPVLEPMELYEAKSGQELVSEQLFSLIDRGERRLALRPEMTPTVARMVAANRGALAFPIRWYSHPNCFRYERPQRGRVREHWQINVDMFGSESPGAEAEIFTLIHRMMEALGAAKEDYLLRVSDRMLMETAFRNYPEIIDEQMKLVFSVLDRWEKVEIDVSRKVLAEAGLSDLQIVRVEEIIGLGLGDIVEIVGEEIAKTSPVVSILRDELIQDSISFDPLIARGFEYYTSTVFEVFDVIAENRRALFGGGRYDNLVALFSDERIPGIGFGMGDVTLVNFLESRGLLPQPNITADVEVIVGEGGALRPVLWEVLNRLRKAGLRTTTPPEQQGVGKQLKRVAKRGIPVVVMIQGNEWERGTVIVRDMNRTQQSEVTLDALVAVIRSIIATESLT